MNGKNLHKEKWKFLSHKLSSMPRKTRRCTQFDFFISFQRLFSPHLNNERQRVEKVKVEPLLDIYKAKKTITKSLLIPEGDWRTKGNFSLFNAEITKMNAFLSSLDLKLSACFSSLPFISVSFVSAHNILSAKLHACLRGRRYLLEASLVVDISFVVLEKVRRQYLLVAHLAR